MHNQGVTVVQALPNSIPGHYAKMKQTGDIGYAHVLLHCSLARAKHVAIVESDALATTSSENIHFAGRSSMWIAILANLVRCPSENH